MILDDLMPQYDVRERHAILVSATPAQVYAALRAADLSSGGVTRALLAVRAIPAALISFVRSPRRASSEIRDRRRERGQGTRLSDFEGAGFHVIAEAPPHELVIGLLGRFWTPRGGLCSDVSVETFRLGPPKGLALAGWNFTISPRANGVCELRTVTRVLCASDARLKFRAYWLVVRPGSGLIRRAMLQAIRREAERAAAAQA